MKKMLLLFALLVASKNSFAESSIMADLREIIRLCRFDPDVPSYERSVLRDKIQARVTPLVNQEFAKLKDGGITPLMREILNDSNGVYFAITALKTQFSTYPHNIQIDVFKKTFEVASDSIRAHLILSFWKTLPKDVFTENDIQKWLVKKIKEGVPARAFYFILTDESARTVTETARTNMKSNTGMGGVNASGLLSAAFLASRGDKDAVKLLDSLLDKRDLNSLLDTTFVFPAAAISGNEKLIQKIREIITTDTRSIFNGHNMMPRETSFAHIAASMCSLTIEDFPSVGYWDDYDDDIKKKVHDWLEANPTHTIKKDFTSDFFKPNKTPFQDVIPVMLETNWGE